MVLNRWKAAGIHLAISLVVASLTASLIYFVWYPQPYFKIASGANLMLLIMSVDIIIGPLLTLVVFKVGKKTLRFDLAVISVLQLCAFSYGLYVISQARPEFIVARADSFYLVASADLEDADFAKATNPDYAKRSWWGPRLVAVHLPSDMRERRDLLVPLNGKDVIWQPKYYIPYTEAADEMMRASQPLADYASKSPPSAAVVNRFLSSTDQGVENFVYLPLHGPADDGLMVISKITKQPFAALTRDP